MLDSLPMQRVAGLSNDQWSKACCSSLPWMPSYFIY